MKRILCMFGTRPEVIKMAPVVRALQATPGVQVRVCVTGQHREMLDQMLAHFDMHADHDLRLMQPGQTPAEFAARAWPVMDAELAATAPDWLVVQGDTTTAMIAGLAAAYRKVKVAHVEAGLRTADKHNPFPEEINRRVLGTLADVHFAPTATAQRALLAEGIAAETIHLTGNTGLDALAWTLANTAPEPAIQALMADGRALLVTTHRRENVDGGIEAICHALQDILAARPEMRAVLPVHPNPAVESTVRRVLEGAERVHLTPPLAYGTLAWALKHAALILTDSGGIQEEATFLGRPMLVLRNTTERPEAVAEGHAELVGTARARITERAVAILSDPVLYARMSHPSAVFGDGHAAERIASLLSTS